jgi:hypothetical protein
MRTKWLIMIALWIPGCAAWGQSWTIGNKQIERTIVFDAARGLTTTKLTDLATGTDFIAPGAVKRQPEFSFLCNGESFAGAGAQFQLVKAEQRTLPDGKSLSMILRSKTTPLDVSVVYRVYNGQPAVRKWLVVRNIALLPVRRFTPAGQRMRG